MCLSIFFWYLWSQEILYILLVIWEVIYSGAMSFCSHHLYIHFSYNVSWLIFVIYLTVVLYETVTASNNFWRNHCQHQEQEDISLCSDQKDLLLPFMSRSAVHLLFVWYAVWYVENAVCSMLVLNWSNLLKKHHFLPYYSLFFVILKWHAPTSS